jgi:hypothetical protein
MIHFETNWTLSAVRHPVPSPVLHVIRHACYGVITANARRSVASLAHLVRWDINFAVIFPLMLNFAIGVCRSSTSINSVWKLLQELAILSFLFFHIRVGIRYWYRQTASRVSEWPLQVVEVLSMPAENIYLRFHFWIAVQVVQSSSVTVTWMFCLCFKILFYWHRVLYFCSSGSLLEVKCILSD